MQKLEFPYKQTVMNLLWNITEIYYKHIRFEKSLTVILVALLYGISKKQSCNSCIINVFVSNPNVNLAVGGLPSEVSAPYITHRCYGCQGHLIDNINPEQVDLVGS